METSHLGTSQRVLSSNAQQGDPADRQEPALFAFRGACVLGPAEKPPRDIAISHQPALEHHIAQGKAWLEVSDRGNASAALSYAAFELRLAVERLAVHYWRALLGRKPEEDDLRDIESFKRIERRIYELGGHQQQIDAHFAFMRAVLGVMKIDAPFKTPNIGVLARYWHECSELCHIGWPLASSVQEVRTMAFEGLSEIANDLFEHARSLGWPIVSHASFEELRNRHAAGQLTDAELLQELQRVGIWARAEYPDGAAHFVGAAVPKAEPQPPDPQPSEA